ncbi:hypothetical protein TSUD_207140 [Trifolium subterraneum]|uniref:CCHC-type domain-containing protein n=1 Tax=Trifolium subterraneum TaxID=3900 RepID=A0A2Z6MY32_TRISU|nr:hypothetical protein TSUD_207140 [Trifolium subterraneum]
MENLNINDTTTGGRNHVDPTTMSSDELLELCLVGSFLTDKPVKFKQMKLCLANLWRPGQQVTISPVEENKFLFQFYHLWDMERVFQGGPWLFDNHMLVFKKLTIVQLDEMEMWVQIFNLPFGYTNESMGLLIGSHLGRYIKYDEYNNSGSWRMYMRVRVAVKVDEPLKKSLTLEKEDGGIVHVYFKYEKLGVFCYVCGVLGHTESFCRKRLEPGFVEGEKGWGTFLKSSNSSIGGGATINKWLRDGKGQPRSGRAGSTTANNGTTAGSTMTGTEAFGINVGQPVQHARFGRVKVIRDVRGRGFIFQTAIANPMQQVAAYNGEVQWVPFVINSETLARPLINSAMGHRALLESINNTSVVPTAAGTPKNSALIVGKTTNGAVTEMITTGSKQKSIVVLSPTAVVVKSPAVNLVATDSSTKNGSVKKKRMRIAQGGNDIEDEVNDNVKEMAAYTIKTATPYLKETAIGTVTNKGAGDDIALHTNPLFDVDIVMAGTGNPSAVRHLKYLIRKYKPDVMILYETLCHSNKINDLHYALGFDNCMAADREGRGGGVALFWMNCIGCVITNYSLNHIDIEVTDPLRGHWRLTGFYGYPEGSRRRDSWNFLRQLSHISNLPWCIIGDFNDILSSDEKKGRTDRANWLIHGFREAVSDAGLIDLVMENYQFTWFKSLGTVRAVEEKLDRALSNNDWNQIFPNARLQCLTATSSDHYPLLLLCDPVSTTPYNNKPFKFENAWLVDPDCDQFVKNSWQALSSHGITNKLEGCASDLLQWSKEKFQSLRKDIDKYHKKLEQLRDHVDNSNINYFNALKKRLSSLLLQDDLFWRQRAKTFWYKDGDLNTKFFHAAATARRKTNRVNMLLDENGVECRDQEVMSVIARDYFINLFEKKHSSRTAVLSALSQSVTSGDNQKLTAPFTIEEFKDAVFSMQSDKCPGPDAHALFRN